MGSPPHLFLVKFVEPHGTFRLVLWDWVQWNPPTWKTHSNYPLSIKTSQAAGWHGAYHLFNILQPLTEFRKYFKLRNLTLTASQKITFHTNGVSESWWEAIVLSATAAQSQEEKKRKVCKKLGETNWRTHTCSNNLGCPQYFFAHLRWC